MLRRLRFTVIAGIACFLPFVCAQTSSDSSLPVPETYFPGLKTLIETAVSQAPRMIARNTESAVAEAERMVTRAAQLPQLRGYASYYPWTQDRRADLTGTTTTEKAAYNFALEQPLFHWGALRDATRIRDLQLNISRGQMAEAYRSLVAEIRAQYLQLVLKRLGLERAHQAQRLADEALSLARDRLERKEIAEADLFGPTIAAEQARLYTDRVQDDYDTARIVLGKLCGTEPIDDAQVPTAIPPITPVSSEVGSLVADFTRRGEVDTIGMRNLRQQIEIERLNYAIASDRLKPKLNAVVGLSQDQQTYVYSPGSERNYRYEVQSLFTGVTLSWSIFDGFATRGAKAASLARRRQLERDYAAQGDAIAMNVKAQQRQLEYAARSLAISEKYLARGRDELARKEEDAKRGLVSANDLETARIQFVDTQNATFAARNDYLLRVAEILSATMNDPALANLPAQLR